MIYALNQGEVDRILYRTLKHLDQNYNIQKVYYPGSGFHKVPKRALGIEKVVHLSKEEIEGGYFKNLGEGIKVQGDYMQSPFKDHSFDATLIWGIPPDTAIISIPEFLRVTKPNGLLITGTSELCQVGYDNFDTIYLFLDRHLNRIKLPKIDFRIRVYQNLKKDSKKYIKE